MTVKETAIVVNLSKNVTLQVLYLSEKGRQKRVSWILSFYAIHKNLISMMKKYFHGSYIKKSHKVYV
jgi:hypothetical protein